MTHKKQIDKDDKKASSNHGRSPLSGISTHLPPQPHPANIYQRVKRSPGTLTSHDVLQLQRTIGNQAVQRMLAEVEKPERNKTEDDHGAPEKNQSSVTGSRPVSIRGLTPTGDGQAGRVIQRNGRDKEELYHDMRNPFEERHSQESQGMEDFKERFFQKFRDINIDIPGFESVLEKTREDFSPRLGSKDMTLFQDFGGNSDPQKPRQGKRDLRWLTQFLTELGRGFAESMLAEKGGSFGPGFDYTDTTLSQHVLGCYLECKEKGFSFENCFIGAGKVQDKGMHGYLKEEFVVGRAVPAASAQPRRAQRALQC